MTNVFISHSSKDKLVAEEIAGQLKERDFLSYFLDFDPEKGIPIGRSWEKELYHRLLACSAVLFICSPDSVSSKWCFAELTHARSLDKKILPVRISNCPLPDILKDIQAIDLCPESGTAFQQMWTELERIGISEEAGFPWDGTRSPYPGIYAFEEEDAAVYFGHKEEAHKLEDLLKRMRFSETRLSLVIGASGCGKSSLVRAGLLPRLRRQKADFIPLKPIIAGPGLLENFAEQLISVKPDTAEWADYETVYNALFEAASSMDRLEGGTFSSLLRRLRMATGRKDAYLLFIVDQAERLLADDKATFKAFQLIGKCASSPGLPLQILLTLRSDHLDAFQASLPMVGAQFETFLLGPLSNQRFGEIIEGPARLVGLKLAPGLVQAMASDACQRDGLPLLAFVLRELWDRFGRKNGQLTLENYQIGLGGLEGCVGNRAKQVRAEHPFSDKDLGFFKKTMCRMARISEGDVFVGQPILWESIPEQTKPIIQRLIDARLLVTYLENDRKVEVAHEVLFKAWEELKSWLKEDLLFMRWQRSIQLPLQEWVQHARNIHEVHLSGVLLQESKNWLESHASSMDEVEHLFVEASLERSKKQEDDWHRSYQISLARQLAAQAQVILTYEAAELADRALLLAVEAMRRCKELRVPSLEADQAIRQGLAINARRTVLQRMKQPVNSEAFNLHPSGATVAYGQKDGHVFLWNLATNQTEAGPKLSSAIEQVAYSPNGQWLMIGDENGICLLFNTLNNKVQKLEQLGIHLRIRTVAFSPDSSYMAVGVYKCILVWDLNTLSDPIVLESDADNLIVSMTFSGDGTVLITQGWRKEAICWNWRMKKVVGRIGVEGKQVIHSSDGRFLGFSGANFEAILWDVYRREIHQIANNCNKISFSADARLVGIASPEHFARTWHLPDLTPAHTMRHNTEVWDLEFSPDSSLMVTIANTNVARIWETHTGNEVARIVHHENLKSARFLTNSRHLLTLSGESTFTVWDIKELREYKLFEHQVAVLGVAFNPGGEFLATNARESFGKLAPVLIDLRNSQPVMNLQSHDGQPVNVTQYAQKLLENHQQSSESKARSPSQEFFAVAEGNAVKIYRTGKEMGEEEVIQGEPISTLPHEHKVLRIIFSPDSRHLITASDHDTARIWDVDLAIEVSRLTHQNPNVVDVDFHPSGKYLATASWDRTARLWIWKPEDLISEATTRLTRNLSSDEWHKYLPDEPYRKTIPELEEEN